MKTGAGEYILGVTRPNGECLQNLVSNPVYVEYFIEALTPAAEMSLHFQCGEIDVVGAVHGIKSFFRIMEKLKESSALIFSTGRVKKFFDVVSSKNIDDNSAFSSAPAGTLLGIAGCIPAFSTRGKGALGPLL